MRVALPRAYLWFGLGLFGAQCAIGQVTHYPVTPTTISSGESIWGDPLSGQIQITQGSNPPSNFSAPYLGLVYSGTNSIEAPYTGFQFATTGWALSMLSAGTTINSSLTWSGSGAVVDSPGWTTFNSPWSTGADGTTGYAGVRLDEGGNYYYGWAEITYNDASQTITLDDFAYDATANQSIEAGQTSAVPEPSTYGVIAGLLALGFALWKSHRSNQLVSAIS